MIYKNTVLLIIPHHVSGAERDMDVNCNLIGWLRHAHTLTWMWSHFTPRLRRFFSSLARMIIVVEFSNNLNFKNKCGCFSEWA